MAQHARRSAIINPLPEHHFTVGNHLGDHVQRFGFQLQSGGNRSLLFLRECRQHDGFDLAENDFKVQHFDNLRLR